MSTSPKHCHLLRVFQGAVQCPDFEGLSSSKVCIWNYCLTSTGQLFVCLTASVVLTMHFWLCRFWPLCNVKLLPTLSQAVTNLCLTQCVPTDGCLVQPSIAGIKETGTDPLPRERWTIPSCYALLNLHLFQYKVTPSLMRIDTRTCIVFECNAYLKPICDGSKHLPYFQIIVFFQKRYIVLWNSDFTSLIVKTCPL